ncbi:hypothetical protein M409DRAFT_69162 [Zasmidium cellare ATCC 36951]|uniref:Uncharacterized protein n=1 Tax=Zasmidium cellare ATCC 36951 TaxID=1080233 RepID=A0A6A6C7K0_ZASCE|nr:uncharacterized protein M409DRAFT_69162 [Zasmidium cellare ATCC 36951]KAF2162228.1 hypothetical protein M409DRAFT_69162 [Zasmidium cellare ATCC 36951]
MPRAWNTNDKTYVLFHNRFDMASYNPQTDYPTVLLFDIGGVCVVSPFQAILDYEKRQNIPLGYINHSISASAPNGAWQRLERGEILLDAGFFQHFKADLSDPQRWKDYYAKTNKTTAQKIPPVADIDVEWLFWEMMGNSRRPDPHMWPALQRLRAVADKSNGKLILGALSNTSIWPPNHPFSDPNTPEGKQNAALRACFDVFVSSAHVGMRKPAEDIYQYAIVRLHEYVKTKGYGKGVRAQDITFLDDIGGNLRTAKKLGMGTIKVQLGRTDKAVVELERITGLRLRDDDKARL